MLTLAVVVVGSIVERVRFGASDATALRHVADDVDRRFQRAAAQLEEATAAIAAHPTHTPPLGLEQRRARTYFQLASSLLQSRPEIDAVSIYDSTGRPIAWAGRPSFLPDERVNGPEALFVAPGPFGLRLVHVRQIKEAGRDTQRLGSVAAEYLLTRDSIGRSGSHADFTLSTSLVPVALRPRFEGGGDSVPPYGFLLRLSGQPPLLEAEVAPEDLRGLRLAWRGKVEGAALTVLALALLGLAVLSRERQERSSTRASYLRHVGGILLLLTGARLLVAMAVPDTWLIQAAGPVAERLLIRSPADFVATALLLLAIVALGADLVERWRLTSRKTAPRGPLPELTFWTANVLVAAGIGVLLAWHEHALAAVVRESGAFGIHFSSAPARSRAPGTRRRRRSDERRDVLVRRGPAATRDDALAGAAAGLRAARGAGGDLHRRSPGNVMGGGGSAFDGPCRAVRAGDLCHGLRGRARALDLPAVPPRLAGIAAGPRLSRAVAPVAGVLSSDRRAGGDRARQQDRRRVRA